MLAAAWGRRLELYDPCLYYPINFHNYIKQLFTDQAVNRDKGDCFPACLSAQLKGCNIYLVVAENGAHFADDAGAVYVSKINGSAFRNNIQMEPVKENDST